MSDQSVSHALRAVIRRDPRTQYQLAQDSGVAAGIISRLLTGERSPTLHVIDRLCKALRLRLVPKEGPKRRKKARK